MDDHGSIGSLAFGKPTISRYDLKPFQIDPIVEGSVSSGQSPSRLSLNLDMSTSTTSNVSVGVI